MTKGIVLAGGLGTRLHPLTQTVSKQMLPVYNKPMIYYPLNTLKQMGIKDILIITANKVQYDIFVNQLGDGSAFELNLQYAIQGAPRGIPEAFIIGDNFIGSDNVVLILGDNVFITHNKIDPTPNCIFTYKVKNPSAYGVAVVNDKELVEIVEKPQTLISNNAVVGLYIFTSECVEQAKKLRPSKRGELEIVDLIKRLNKAEGVTVEELDGFWFDCGNFDDLLDCANLVRAIEHRTNTVVGLKS